ncbi:hypothetical protein KCU93_g3, partial [Aureobasidium melanogenum]
MALLAARRRGVTVEVDAEARVRTGLWPFLLQMAAHLVEFHVWFGGEQALQELVDSLAHGSRPAQRLRLHATDGTAARMAMADLPSLTMRSIVALSSSVTIVYMVAEDELTDVVCLSNSYGNRLLRVLKLRVANTPKLFTTVAINTPPTHVRLSLICLGSVSPTLLALASGLTPVAWPNSSFNNLGRPFLFSQTLALSPVWAFVSVASENSLDTKLSQHHAPVHSANGFRDVAFHTVHVLRDDG